MAAKLRKVGRKCKLKIKKPQTRVCGTDYFSQILVFYFVKTFACLQMYIASRAAAASTASEIIVNIIIVTLSLIFKFVNPKNFLSYLARSNLFPFDNAKVRTISISCITF